MHLISRIGHPASTLALAIAWTFAPAPSAHAAVAYQPPAAQVIRATGAQALAPAGDRAAAMAQVLRQRGAGAATAQSLVVEKTHTAKGGVTHVQFKQQVGGLDVYGSSVKAAFNGRGELIHLAQRVVILPASAPQRAPLGELQALQAAMAAVHPGVAATFVRGPVSGATVRFTGGAFFHEDPEVTRVLVPGADGSLAEGFLVQTWTQRGNLLDNTLVAGDGTVLHRERLTANDSYNVFTVDPGKGPQAVVPGPGSGNPQSPVGWLAGAQSTILISGNNASSYLDTAGHNRPDRGGTAVLDGNFLAQANFTLAPTVASNPAVAVQNLFYLVNRIHDILYGHGFTEGAGNFQENNFGLGGKGRDPVNAEAQDGGGTDNANFATPPDGRRPRMQMYLWTGAGSTHEVVIAAGPTYGAMGASFGPSLSTTGLSGTVVLGDDGVAGGSVYDGCEALPATLKGKLVLLDRGGCNFTVKVKNAQTAGALGVIIANNQAAAPFTMGGTDRSLRIPALMISQGDGADLRVRVSPSGTMRLKAEQPLQIDAALDSDVVYHEYGHGLTWRMIGSMGGPLAGAVGEGASDVLAFLVNQDDVIGEYAMSHPLGIRRFRYAGYPLTYASVTGEEVHNDGEIYAAAMWRLRELWLLSGLSNDSLFGHFVDGMNYTPSTPAFEDMRNGLLDSINNSAVADATARCTLVWQAFAQFGIGAGASGTVLKSGGVAIVPSTVARSDCSY